MKQKDFTGYGYEPRKDSAGMKAIKKAVKEACIEQFIRKGLNLKKGALNGRQESDTDEKRK